MPVKLMNRSELEAYESGQMWPNILLLAYDTGLLATDEEVAAYGKFEKSGGVRINGSRLFLELEGARVVLKSTSKPLKSEEFHTLTFPDLLEIYEQNTEIDGEMKWWRLGLRLTRPAERLPVYQQFKLLAQAVDIMLKWSKTL